MQVQPSLITPGDPFDIFYFLRNPIDNATYYVQAVIYDVRTGVVLATTQLSPTATNPHLFISRLQAPADSQSLGRNIVAIASVYTDSGYTTKSDAYEEQEQYFLVKAAPTLLGGGVDYRVIREMMQEEVAKGLKSLPQPAPETEPAPMPFDALFGTLGALQREINRIPKEDTDLSGISEQLTALKDAIAALPQEAPETPDYTPILAAITALKTELGSALTDVRADTAGLPSFLQPALEQILGGMEKRMTDAMVKAISEQEISIPAMRTAVTPKPAPIQPLDVSHLMQ